MDQVTLAVLVSASSFVVPTASFIKRVTPSVISRCRMKFFPAYVLPPHSQNLLHCLRWLLEFFYPIPAPSAAAGLLWCGCSSVLSVLQSVELFSTSSQPLLTGRGFLSSRTASASSHLLFQASILLLGELRYCSLKSTGLFLRQI